MSAWIRRRDGDLPAMVYGEGLIRGWVVCRNSAIQRRERAPRVALNGGCVTVTAGSIYCIHTIVLLAHTSSTLAPAMNS